MDGSCNAISFALGNDAISTCLLNDFSQLFESLLRFSSQDSLFRVPNFHNKSFQILVCQSDVEPHTKFYNLWIEKR